MRPRIFGQDTPERENWVDNLAAWLVNYTWNAIARINLDPDIMEDSVVRAAPHIFEIDLLAYNENSLYKKYLCNLKKNLAAFLK